MATGAQRWGGSLGAATSIACLFIVATMVVDPPIDEESGDALTWLPLYVMMPGSAAALVASVWTCLGSRRAVNVMAVAALVPILFTLFGLRALGGTGVAAFVMLLGIVVGAVVAMQKPSAPAAAAAPADVRDGP